MLESLVNIIYSLTPGIAVLVVLVTIHELGHWFFLKRYGVFVDRFSVGFGKPLCSLSDKSGTHWTLAPVLLGGYVSFPYTEDDIPERMKGYLTEKDAFNGKTARQRAAVMFGGPLVNIVFALACMLLIGFFWGVPQPVLEREYAPLSLQKGDVIIAVNGQDMTCKWLFSRIDALTVERAGERHDVALPDPIVPYASSVPFAMKKGCIPGAFLYGMRVFYSECCRLWGAIKDVFTGNLNKLGGMPTIMKAASSRWEKGGATFWLFVGMLSLSLGGLNLLPLPGLDGGHLLLLAFSVTFCRGKPLPHRVEKVVMYISLGILLGVIAFVNIRDIMRLDFVQKFVGWLSKVWL